jgi:hypothetical protein
MDRNIILRGIREAEEELARINAQLETLEPLKRQKAMIEGYLVKARLLAGDESEVPPRAPVPEPTAAVSQSEAVLWEGVRRVLAHGGTPLRAGDIVRRLTDWGWTFTENGSEIVRTTMGRKPDIFERLGGGLYALKQWPEEFKREFDSESGNGRLSIGS